MEGIGDLMVGRELNVKGDAMFSSSMVVAGAVTGGGPYMDSSGKIGNLHIYLFVFSRMVSTVNWSLLCHINDMRKAIAIAIAIDMMMSWW